MAQKLQIVPVTLGLVTLLASRLKQTYDAGVDVREAGNKDFNDAGELVLSKIAVRVRFGNAEYAATRDLTRTTLSAGMNYQIICRHESLRSQEEQRSRTLDLATAVMEELAGARLLLIDGTSSEPISVLGVDPVSDSYGPVDNCFGVTVRVDGFAQFDGRNAQPRGEVQ